MDMNSANIEEIVKQVLAGMSGNASAAASAPAVSALQRRTGRGAPRCTASQAPLSRRCHPASSLSPEMKLEREGFLKRRG